MGIEEEFSGEFGDLEETDDVGDVDAAPDAGSGIPGLVEFWLVNQNPNFTIVQVGWCPANQSSQLKYYQIPAPINQTCGESEDVTACAAQERWAYAGRVGCGQLIDVYIRIVNRTTGKYYSSRIEQAIDVSCSAGRTWSYLKPK